MRASRNEAVDRQDLDDGAPDEIVFMVSNGNSQNRIYHEDPECHRLKGRDIILREYTRANAQRRWLGPCQWCVLEGEP